MFFVGVTPISSVFCIRKPSSATKLAKKKETPGSVSAARGFFWLSNQYLGCRSLVLVAQGFLHGLCFFLGVVLLQFLLAFASTSLHRLLSLQKKETPGSVSAARGLFVFQIII